MSFQIDPQAVYITPLGRRCRVDKKGPRWVNQSSLQYIVSPGVLEVGFVLTEANYYILRKEARRAPAR